MTPYINSWDEAYRLAADKRKNITLTTLRKPDRTLTAGQYETLKHMLEHFTPEDNHNDTDCQTQARILSQEPVDTEDVKDFTVEEIRNAVGRSVIHGSNRLLLSLTSPTTGIIIVRGDKIMGKVVCAELLVL
jgi:hypothetical protein